FTANGGAVGTYFNAASQSSAVTDSFVADRFIIVAGNRLDISVDFLTGAFAGNLSVSVQYFDNGGNPLSESAKFPVTGTNGSNFKTFIFNDTAPANTQYASLKINVTGATWTTLRWRRVKVDLGIGFPTAFNMDGNWFRMLQQSFAFTNPIFFNGLWQPWNATTNNLTGVSIGRSGSQAGIGWVNAGGVADSKMWDAIATGTQKMFRLINDAN
ncbi:hypothetical protein, partial [Acinetobacter baumannii]|uniref:hypothetical protein n=1 Tax=Acinetobacter baumannii TaxID=470 RepID=UPI001920AC67